MYHFSPFKFCLSVGLWFEKGTTGKPSFFFIYFIFYFFIGQVCVNNHLFKPKTAVYEDKVSSW